MNYFRKMCGCGRSGCTVDPVEAFWSFVGALCGIGLVAWLCEHVGSPADGAILIGSFGASAVLAYGAPSAPLSQPRNLVGGHVLSALVGVATWQTLGPTPWLAAAVAVATAIALMHMTGTLHPPGGATALIAVTGSPAIHDLGYGYAFMPVGAGALLLLGVAVTVNNIPRHRRYPLHWW